MADLEILALVAAVEVEGSNDSDHAVVWEAAPEEVVPAVQYSVAVLPLVLAMHLLHCVVVRLW